MTVTYSNFRRAPTIGDTEYGQVDESTARLLRKPVTVARSVYKAKYSTWRFLDTGGHPLTHEIEYLADANNAMTALIQAQQTSTAMS